MYWAHHPQLSNTGDPYGFVNEHEVRVTSGIKLIFAVAAFVLITLKGEIEVGLIIVSILFLEFLLKVVWDPKYSVFGILARLLVKGKEAEWVGAIQKRFAWWIGLVISSIVLFMLIGMNFYGTPPVVHLENFIVLDLGPVMFLCLLCIVFMWLESVVGFCAGCYIYKFLVQKKILQSYSGQNCINGACEIRR